MDLFEIELFGAAEGVGFELGDLNSFPALASFDLSDDSFSFVGEAELDDAELYAIGLNVFDLNSTLETLTWEIPVGTVNFPSLDLMVIGSGFLSSEWTYSEFGIEEGSLNDGITIWDDALDLGAGLFVDGDAVAFDGPLYVGPTLLSNGLEISREIITVEGDDGLEVSFTLNNQSSKLSNLI